MTRRRIFRAMFWTLVALFLLTPLRAAQVMARTGWTPDLATVVFLSATAFILGLWLNYLAPAHPRAEQ